MNFQVFVILVLIFMFLQDFIILAGTQKLLVAPFFILANVFTLFVARPKRFITNLIPIYKYTPFKYLVWFIIFMIVSSFLYFNLATTFRVIFRVIMIYALTVIPAILFAIYIFPKIFSYKKLLKVFIIAYHMIVYYGILDFICKVFFNIKAPLYDILCTKNYYSHILGASLNLNSNVSNRASSIFFEASFFATFLFLFMPLCYMIYKSDVKLIKNTTLDKIFRINLIIITWLALLFTKSPIYIILSLIYTGLFFYKDIIKFVKKYIVIFLIPFIVLTFGIILSDTNPSDNTNPIIERIYNTVNSFGNLDSLVIIEPSLATRVISTANTYQAAKKHILIGVGYGNTKDVMYKQYAKTKTPLTLEIIRSIQIDMCFASPNIFWSYLLQTGIIGTCLLYLFFLKSIFGANRIKKYFIKEDGLLLNSLILVAINYIIISFYWSLDIYPMMWFIFGLLNSFIFYHKKNNRKYITENKYVENSFT